MPDNNRDAPHEAATAEELRADIFNVTMLGVLAEPFQQWLATRNLVMARLPGEDDIPGHYIVVPKDFGYPAARSRP